MSAVAELIAVIRGNWELSDAAWEMAIDTAGPEYLGGSEERQEALRELADECGESYDAALVALEHDGGPRYTEARGHLIDAQRLEDEGGDASHARAAREALAAWHDARPYHERRRETAHCPECLSPDCYSVNCDERASKPEE